MKRTVRRHYGEDAGNCFKASANWLFRFTKHFSMSLRRKINGKHMSLEERLLKCKRWHARFRRRLKGEPAGKLHPKWGRWLPENRLSIDHRCRATSGKAGRIPTRMWVRNACT